MAAKRIKPESNEIPEDVNLEGQEAPQDEPEPVVLAEEATPLDIESRRLEHQRRINEGGR